MRPASVPARGPSPGIPAVALTTAGWAVGGAVTLALLGSAQSLVGYRDPALHLVLDTVDSCVALLVACLVHGRLARGGSRQDLLLAHGLVLLALSGFGLTYLTDLIGRRDDDAVDAWLPLTIRLVAAVVLVVASLSDDARPAAPRSGRWSAVVVPVGVVVAAVAVFCAIENRLPAALGSVDPPGSPGPGTLSGHPVLLGAHVVSALCFAVASAAFTARAARHDDPLLRWLGPAFALAALSRVAYLVVPSLYTEWLHGGDLLRTGCYLLLLVGATQELRQHWAAQPRVAVADDRRRLARELHDGVIQELAFIRSESHALPAGMTRDLIRGACDRALDEARAAVQVLGRYTDQPLPVVVERVVAELRSRHRVPIDLAVDGSVDAGPEQQHALMRILREAVSNAVRHGQAEHVRVELDRDGDRRRLLVRDDGSGFDVAAVLAGNGGYGLTSMHERARALPGSCDVEAAPGRGSVVTVRW